MNSKDNEQTICHSDEVMRSREK